MTDFCTGRPKCIAGTVRLCSTRFRVSLDPMSIHAQTSYRGYRYYRLPNGTPEAAARV
jgi:hypothetical protein